MHHKYCQITILLVVHLCSSLAYFMMTQPMHAIHTLTHPHTHTHTFTHPYMYAIHTHTHTFSLTSLHVSIHIHIHVGDQRCKAHLLLPTQERSNYTCIIETAKTTLKDIFTKEGQLRVPLINACLPAKSNTISMHLTFDMAQQVR